MNRKRRVFLAAILCIVAAAGAGWFDRLGLQRAWAQKESGPAQVERVALLPFFKGVLTYNVQDSLTCPVCRLIEDSDSNVPDADRILTELVQKRLEKRFGYAVVHPSKVKAVYDSMPKDETKDTPLSLAQRLGRHLGASHVVVGNVWRFRERVGGSMGVESPASVAFLIHLVEVATGTVLWKGTFNETQRSLSENILDAPAFFKRGAKWLTAEELARHGVDDLFRKMTF
ncbi:MAG: hypothetical protein AB1512_18470 [Thermodesulfobacteriota bacterium]